MWGPTKSKSVPILGVDIGAASIKIIELSKQSARYCIQEYGLIELPLHAVEEHIIRDIDAVSESIHHLISKGNFSSRNVALAVPDSFVMTHVIQIETDLQLREIEELVLIEAEKYISFPIDELYIDFHLLGSSAANPALQELLIVASRVEFVQQRVEAVVRAGLFAQIVDVESFALARSTRFLDSVPCLDLSHEALQYSPALVMVACGLALRQFI